MRAGFTLPELTLLVALIAMGGSVALPRVGSQLDVLAVRAAREAAAGALARTRAEAPLRGGAVLRAEEPGGLLVVAGEVVVDSLDLARAGVRMEIEGAATTAEIRFDALGIGRVASRTLSFHRGNASAGLVVSAYGRVTRR